MESNNSRRADRHRLLILLPSSPTHLHDNPHRLSISSKVATRCLQLRHRFSTSVNQVTPHFNNLRHPWPRNRTTVRILKRNGRLHHPYQIKSTCRRSTKYWSPTPPSMSSLPFQDRQAMTQASQWWFDHRTILPNKFPTLPFRSPSPRSAHFSFAIPPTIHSWPADTHAELLTSINATVRAKSATTSAERDNAADSAEWCRKRKGQHGQDALEGVLQGWRGVDAGRAG